MIIKTTKEALQEISLSKPLCLPDVPYGLAWNQTWSFAVRGHRLTAWAILHSAGAAVCHVAAWSGRKRRSHYPAKFLQYAIEMLKSISSVTPENIFISPSKPPQIILFILFILKSHIEINKAITQKTNVLQECSLKFSTVNRNACVVTKNVIREEQQTQES
jgi:hypothetical protein